MPSEDREGGSAMSVTIAVRGNATTVEVFVLPGGEVQRRDVAAEAAPVVPGGQSRAIGMRELELTAEEAEAITRILDSPAVPIRRGEPVSLGDPALLTSRAD